jgi:hypothetical protein
MPTFQPNPNGNPEREEKRPEYRRFTVQEN